MVEGNQAGTRVDSVAPAKTIFESGFDDPSLAYWASMDKAAWLVLEHKPSEPAFEPSELRRLIAHLRIWVLRYWESLWLHIDAACWERRWIDDESETGREQEALRDQQIQKVDLWQTAFAQMIAHNHFDGDGASISGLRKRWLELQRELSDRVEFDSEPWIQTSSFQRHCNYRRGLITADMMKRADELRAIAQDAGFEKVSHYLWSDDCERRHSDIERGLSNRFSEYATAGEFLARHCQNTADVLSMVAYRWHFSSTDEVNLIREAFLAGVRLWIDRALAVKEPHASTENLAEYFQLMTSVLGAVDEAYSFEAPSTLLGYKEADILRLAFPFMFGRPAESSIDADALRKRFNGEAEFRSQFENFDDCLFEHRLGWDSLYGEVCRDCGSAVILHKTDIEFERRRVVWTVIKRIQTVANSISVDWAVTPDAIPDAGSAAKLLDVLLPQCLAQLIVRDSAPSGTVPSNQIALRAVDRGIPVFDDFALSVSNRRREEAFFRDHHWLKLRQSGLRSPAIRDWWNNLPADERQRIAKNPKYATPITLGDEGNRVVKTALKLAESEHRRFEQKRNL